MASSVIPASTPSAIRMVYFFVPDRLALCSSLSLPVLLAGFAVAGGGWVSLAWNVAAVLAMVTSYRLAGAVMHLVLLRRGIPTFVALRGLVAGTYLLFPLVLPAASQPMLSYHLLSDGHSSSLAVGGMPGHWVFVAVYLALSGVCAIVLFHLLQRRRESQPPAAQR